MDANQQTEPLPTLADEWGRFYEAVVAMPNGEPPLPDELVNEIRRTFYAGAVAALHTLSVSPGPLTIESVKLLFMETMEFAATVEAGET